MNHIPIDHNPYKNPVRKWLVSRYGTEPAEIIWNRTACSEAREYLAIRENIASLYDAERKENADRKKRKEQER